nr:MLO-like protein 12 isoform X2 [Ipomoea trifida]
MAAAAKERTMEATPTWAIAVVCFLLLRKQKKALHESLDKIKTELMLMGFISLLLTIFQDPVSNICVPKSVGNSWHPCDKIKDPSKIKDPCKAKGKVQFASAYAIHQLHIFIFALAVTHVMRSWKDWEHETKTLDYQFEHEFVAADPERFRFARDTSFVQRHSHFWNKSSIFLWMAHLPPQNRPNFDFQMYISLALEADLWLIVCCSPVLWLFAVLSFLTNTNGWYSYLWLPFIPLLNAFQVAFFFWSWYKFGVPSCFHKNVADIAIRLSMGVIIQILCSYVTLPLYALVNQMGSCMKPVIFGDNVASALKNWRHAAKHRAKHGHGRRSEHASPLHGSPVHLLSDYQRNVADHDADDLVWANSGGTSGEPHRNLSQEKGPAAGAMEISIK